MKCIIEGTVLENYEIEKKEGNQIIKEIVARIFQPGEKNLLEVKGIPEKFPVNKKVSLLVKLYFYNFNNRSGFSCKYIDQIV